MVCIGLNEHVDAYYFQFLLTFAYQQTPVMLVFLAVFGYCIFALGPLCHITHCMTCYFPMPLYSGDRWHMVVLICLASNQHTLKHYLSLYLAKDVC